jgi:Ni2+-binding GTPase involved in maturation of urease and hydrogenase
MAGPSGGPDIDVLVVGGYLGAGKTTFVNHLLRQGTGRRTMVLVNDFGSVAVDADLIEATADDMVTLTNGCVCCGLSSPLIDTLIELRERNDLPELLVVECSGVADPMTVAHHAMIPGYHLDGVVVVADAETVRRRAADPIVGRTVRRQLAAADLLLLNKVDLLPDGAADGLADWLSSEAPGALVVRSVRSEVPVAVVLGVGTGQAGNWTEGEDGHHHEADDHDTATWVADEPLRRDDVIAFVGSLPVGALRAKGILRLHESPDRRTVLQVVGRRFELVDAGPWQPEDSSGRLVVIGLPGSLEDLKWPGAATTT